MTRALRLFLSQIYTVLAAAFPKHHWFKKVTFFYAKVWQWAVTHVPPTFSKWHLNVLFLPFAAETSLNVHYLPTGGQGLGPHPVVLGDWIPNSVCAPRSVLRTMRCWGLNPGQVSNLQNHLSSSESTSKQRGGFLVTKCSSVVARSVPGTAT